MKLGYSLVTLDSELFGFPVAQLSPFRLDAEEDAEREFGRFEAWRDANAVRVASCRIDHELLRESMCLEAHGFRFIELVYHPRFDAVQSLDFADPRLDVALAAEPDLPAIEAIADSAFATGRYGLDWRLDPALGARRYARWARSAIAHPTQRLVKAEDGGRIVGFFVIETSADKRCYWHLTAVAPEAQGRGIGARLWRAMLMLHKAQGVATVETCVSAHNLRVLNLYATLGFRLTQAEMTFHWVRGR